MGRPKTLSAPLKQFTLKLSKKLCDQFDMWCLAHDVNRAAQIRELMRHWISEDVKHDFINIKRMK